MDAPRRALSARQAGIEYGLDRATIARAIRRGELPASRPGVRRYTILRDDLEAWIRGYRVHPSTVAERVEAALAREGRAAP